jgi:formamidopyrimidine-DNA glycosylase
MPELPEVETVRRGLQPALEGRRIERVTQNRPNLRFPFPANFTARLEGQTVDRVGRRSKYLLLELSSGETLLMHLGMSGRFSIEAEAGAGQPGDFVHATPANPRHDHVIFDVSGGVTVRYNDPRRFGFMDLIGADELATSPHLVSLGPEPHTNSFSDAYLLEAVAGKRAPIKSVLLDQHIIAGLGNIYVCEALHRAGVSPRREARTLGAIRAGRLARSIRDVILEAIESGGSSLKDFAGTDGALGYFQHRFRAYGREGEKCPTAECGKPIRRIVQSGRSTFYCSACQR